MRSKRKYTTLGLSLVFLLCIDAPLTKLFFEDDSSLVEAQKMQATLSATEKKLESKSVTPVVLDEYEGKLGDLRAEVDSLVSSEQQKLEWNLWSDIGKPLFWLIVLIGYFTCIKSAEPQR